MPTVHVFTRHASSCAHKSKPYYKRCDCLKWLRWSHDGTKHRQTTHSRDWDTASQMGRKIEQDYERAALGKPSVPGAGITIEQAVRWYLVDRESQHLKPATMSKLQTIFEKQMVGWFHDLEVRFLREIDLPQLIGWRGSWSDGPLAAKKKQERVSGFFWWCFRNKWIAENPALGLSKIKADIRPAVPFTPDEFATIVEACDEFGKTDAQRARIKAMVLLLRWSGLAIRDAVTLQRAQLDAQDRLMLRRAKTGVAVFVPLKPEVVSMLRNVPDGPRPNPRYFFWSGQGNPKSAVADWQRALRRLFAIADLRHADGSLKRCHPHQFRHTFSVEMLLAGVPIEDVARLLGHSSVRTTEKYYSSWVAARAERLENSVRAAWK